MMMKIEQLSSSLDPGPLAHSLTQALRPTLFSNSAYISPRRLKKLAQQMSTSFLAYLEAPDEAVVQDYGRRLALEGLGHQAILIIVQVLCSLWEDAKRTVPSAKWRHSTERYVYTLLAGYMAGAETRLLHEQELIHRAYLRALKQ